MTREIVAGIHKWRLSPSGSTCSPLTTVWLLLDELLRGIDGMVQWMSRLAERKRQREYAELAARNRAWRARDSEGAARYDEFDYVMGSLHGTQRPTRRRAHF